MNENEKRLFADVAAEDKEYMRMMASAKRSSIFIQKTHTSVTTTAKLHSTMVSKMATAY